MAIDGATTATRLCALARLNRLVHAAPSLGRSRPRRLLWPTPERSLSCVSLPLCVPRVRSAPPKPSGRSLYFFLWLLAFGTTIVGAAASTLGPAALVYHIDQLILNSEAGIFNPLSLQARRRDRRRDHLVLPSSYVRVRGESILCGPRVGRAARLTQR